MSRVNWDWSFAWSILPDLLGGLVITIQATILGTLLGTVLGFVWLIVKLAQVPVLSTLAHWAVEVIRGTPFLIQVHLIFFALPAYGITLSPFATGVIALGIYSSSYISEVYRSGLEAIPSGQWEACLTLGLPLRRVWLGVAVPQALRTVIPMLGNVMIGMFKESSILSTITLLELIGRAMNIGSAQFRYIEPITIAGVLYFAVSYIAAKSMQRLELKLDLTSRG